MFDYFTTQIQFDELVEIQNWNDAMEDPCYFMKNKWCYRITAYYTRLSLGR